MPELRRLSDLDVEQAEVPVTEINDLVRARQDYKDLNDLAESIRQKGLIHPIAVVRYEQPFSPSPGRVCNYFLLAGGRRYKAIESILKWEKIPVRIYPAGLNGFEMRSIELEENIKREDLSDAERIKLVKAVHDLYISMYGEKTSTSASAKGHSARDTAKLLGVSPSKISGDLEIGQWMEEIPALAALGDRKKIKQMIDRAKKESIKKGRLKAAGIDISIPSSDLLESSYIVGDFFKLIKDVPSGTVDLVEIDIDYPMDIDNNINYNQSKQDKAMNIYTSISKEDYPDLMKKSLEEAYRVLQENSWCLVWFGREYFSELQAWGKEVGFRTSFYTGKWYKTDGHANCRNALRNLKHSMEEFFYFKKGAPSLHKAHSDVFTCVPNISSQKTHPYEKPITLMYEIFETFLHPGARIEIPFAGSGHSLLAGSLYNCIVRGTDTSEEYYKDFLLKVNKMKTRG